MTKMKDMVKETISACEECQNNNVVTRKNIRTYSKGTIWEDLYRYLQTVFGVAKEKKITDV